MMLSPSWYTSTQYVLFLQPAFILKFHLKNIFEVYYVSQFGQYNKNNKKKNKQN